MASGGRARSSYAPAKGRAAKQLKEELGMVGVDVDPPGMWLYELADFMSSS
jgi:hypothetical protein